MKATKKIVGASCALVAAVALSAGSTFAWFASSNQVTATGMKIQATVPANLYIDKTYKTDVADVNETTISFATDDVASLSPVAISNSATSPAVGALTSGAIYALDPATYEENKNPSADSSGTAATYGKVATGAVSTTSLTWTGDDVRPATDPVTQYKPTDYIYSKDMTLANKSSAIDVAAEVKLSVPATTGTNTYMFIRAGFVIGTPTVDESGTTWSYEYKSIANGLTTDTDTATGVKVVTEGEGTTAQQIVTFSYDDLIENFAGNEVRTITFLVWFDGDDVDCKVNNAIKVDTFTVSIEYNATAVAATPEP